MTDSKQLTDASLASPLTALRQVPLYGVIGCSLNIVLEHDAFHSGKDFLLNVFCAGAELVEMHLTKESAYIDACLLFILAAIACSFNLCEELEYRAADCRETSRRCELTFASFARMIGSDIRWCAVRSAEMTRCRVSEDPTGTT